MTLHCVYYSEFFLKKNIKVWISSQLFVDNKFESNREFVKVDMIIQYLGGKKIPFKF